MTEQLFCDNCGKLNWSRWAETCECRHPKFIHGEHVDYLEAKKREADTNG